jgi:hypothetical protein
MIEANKYIFNLLANFVENQNIDVPIFRDAKRCIETNEDDKRWLQQVKIITEQSILPYFRTATFEFDNKNYFVAIGWQDKLELEQEIIEEIELNGGMVTALLFDLKVSVKQTANAYQIANNILYLPEKDIIRYKFSEINHFFEPLFVYQINDKCPFVEIKSDIIKIANVNLSAFYIIQHRQIISLRFQKETLLVFERLFTEGVKVMQYDTFENLLFSLVSVSWKHSFLDVYRCIERLFSISFWQEFYEGLEVKDSLLNFSAKIENYTDWRPQEKEAINKLIDHAPEEAINLLREIKNDLYGNSEGKLGEFIYEIRNSIVHFRPATKPISIDNQNWDKLIRACLLVIECLYHQYEEMLNK